MPGAREHFLAERCCPQGCRNHRACDRRRTGWEEGRGSVGKRFKTRGLVEHAARSVATATLRRRAACPQPAPGLQSWTQRADLHFHTQRSHAPWASLPRVRWRWRGLAKASAVLRNAAAPPPLPDPPPTPPSSREGSLASTPRPPRPGMLVRRGGWPATETCNPCSLSKALELGQHVWARFGSHGPACVLIGRRERDRHESAGLRAAEAPCGGGARNTGWQSCRSTPAKTAKHPASAAAPHCQCSSSSWLGRTTARPPASGPCLYQRWQRLLALAPPVRPHVRPMMPHLGRATALEATRQPDSAPHPEHARQRSNPHALRAA